MKKTMLALVALLSISSSAFATTKSVASNFEDPNNVFSTMGTSFSKEKSLEDCDKRKPGRAHAMKINSNGTAKVRGGVVVDQGHSSL